MPDHLTCLLRNVYRSRSNSKNQTWNNRLVPNQERSTSKLYIVTLLIYIREQSTSCKMPGWIKHNLESKLPGEISVTSRYADDTTLMAESKEELKSLLMQVKEESEKVDLKLNIQQTKIMAFSPITSWQIDREIRETVADFIF